jgi:hypothetical protein
MDTVVSKLTVFYEGPFWVGVCERVSGGRLEAAKVTFGSEPKDCEVYDFILSHWGRIEFSPPVADKMDEVKHTNPKRLHREAQKAVSETGVGTKAQQALKLQYKQNKSEQKKEERKKSEEEKDRQFELRQQQRKEKHRGR